MDYAQFLNDLKRKNDLEVQTIANFYGIPLTTSEISALRPLLNDISFHWLLTGIPDSFVRKVRYAVGDEKTETLFRMYFDATK